MKLTAIILFISCFSAAGYSISRRHGGPSLTSRKRVLLFKKPPVKLEDGSSSLLDGEIPANLKRKVKARRVPLGHVVPKDIRKAQAGGTANPRLRPQGVAREAGLNNPSNLKILGGSAKGKRLDSPGMFFFVYLICVFFPSLLIITVSFSKIYNNNKQMYTCGQ